MKKQLLLLSILFTSVTIQMSYAQGLDMNGLEINKKNNLKTTEQPVSFKTSGSERALTEINTSLADAYPFISSDGLRLYTIVNGTGYSVYSRNTISDNFGNKTTLTNIPSLSSTITGIWLNNDETELFYIETSKLYHSSRANTGTDFSIPVQVSLVGNFSSFLAGPSLSPDLNELYLFSTITGSDNITIQLTKTSTNEYTLKDTLDLPVNTTSSPGQLSKDGLKYFTGLDYGDKLYKIGYFSRTSLTTKFSNFMEIPEVNNSSVANVLCSVTGDEKIMVFVRNPQNNWDGNDLYISSIQVTTPIITDVKEDFQIYPNPVADQLSIKAENKIDKIRILNSQGIEAASLTPINNQATIDLSKLESGIYVLILEKSGKLYSQKIVKK